MRELVRQGSKRQGARSGEDEVFLSRRRVDKSRRHAVHRTGIGPRRCLNLRIRPVCDARSSRNRQETPRRWRLLCLIENEEQAEARRDHGCVVGDLDLRGGLAGDLRAEAGPHLGPEEAAADVAPGRSGGALDRPDGRAGFGGPAVSGGKVYVLNRDEKVGDTLRAMDLASGKELWTFAYDAPGSFMFAGSRTIPPSTASTSTPSARWGICTRSASKSQKPVWRANIWKDFGGGAELPHGDGPEPVDLR